VVAKGHPVLLSFSRGGMLGLIIVAGLSFLLIPKKLFHYTVFALVVAGGLYLAGAEVQERFGTTFAGGNQRDSSAQSRLDLWAVCLNVMIQEPLVGIGPDHFGLNAHRWGFPEGKQAHTLWLQLGVEVGVPGLCFLLLFYLQCLKGLWPIRKETSVLPDPWLRDAACMVIAGLVGFMVTAQFVSLWGLELPYYVALLGAGTIKVAALRSPSPAPSEDGALNEAVLARARSRNPRCPLPT
jgi:O-antigen ligase